MSDTTYEHVGISITGPPPGDVAPALRYGRWLRMGIEDCWSLNDARATILEAHRQGAKVLACIQPCGGTSRYAGWTAARYHQFGDYARAIADLGVDAIECGNELNNPMFNGARDDIQSVAIYLPLIIAAAIRANHPTTKIITNGWSPMGGGPPAQYPQNALKQTAPYLHNTVDGWGFHPYEMRMHPTEPAPPDRPGWNPCWQLRAFAGNTRPFWLTEFGFHGTDTDQETWLVDYFKAFAAHRAAGVKIENVFWHTLREGQSTVSAEERTMGLLRPDGSEKPAGARLRALGKTLWS